MLWVKNKNKIKHINNKCCEFLQKHLTDDAEVVTEDALLSKAATQQTDLLPEVILAAHTTLQCWQYLGTIKTH